jgi:selenocysteine-specific elongation factor
MYVIGTAGHVDHGKSALVQALTGIDPDRLREEKERGLTIDLGFAWLTLPGGAQVSIVDVPGHERFIKNMLAGVGGIDLALLVIAADEGVMPQTREHLAIIDLLGIDHGVVALTKADLVDRDLLELALADAREVLRGTSLEGSPVVACSSVTREGLEDLLAALEAELEKTPTKRDIGRPRLPVDRAFTIAGFGTVVTGTLTDGSLRTGQEVEVLPAGLRARVRGLQTHSRSTEVAPPGRRTAVNLTGVAVEDVRRGMVVTTPGWLKPTSAVDVRLRAVRYLDRPIRHNLTVTFHSGSAEVEGRVVLLDRHELAAGESGWAQIRLAGPIAAVRGDRFVIRDPNDTLGGGRIVDTHVKRHRRFHPETIAALEALERGSPEELVTIAVSRSEPVEMSELVKRVELEASVVRQVVAALVESGELVALDGGDLKGSTLLWTAAGFRSLKERLQEALSAYHRQAPLKRGMPKEELRNRLGLSARAFDQALSVWAAAGDLRDAGASVSLPTHRPSPGPADAERARRFVAELQASPYSPSPSIDLPEDLLTYLEDEGQIVRAGDGVIFASNAYREMVNAITAYIREHGSVTLAQVRDMFGTSRKYAQALLEYMDSQHITRRVGDERVLRRA